jgi:hypothetical protein
MSSIEVAFVSPESVERRRAEFGAAEERSQRRGALENFIYDHNFYLWRFYFIKNYDILPSECPMQVCFVYADRACY